MTQALDHILQAAPAAKKDDSKPVGPTLMVGLGGTGKEVLLRLRRSIVERYGSLSALPFIQYLHLDTDGTLNARQQYDLPASDDPLHEDVRFRPSERIDLTIDGGTGKYVEHLHTYPHIKRWFPSSGKIADLGNLGDGAGQVRVASRLAFYHAPNFNKISSSLDRARRHLSDPAILNQVGDLGFEFEPNGMDIFVVCSLAGGTGGGTFLDMGFLLKRFFGKSTLAGILMLPSFFAGYAGGNRVQGNGYAALMELNHYCFGHTFTANWDGNSPESLQPPPFDVTYLVDGTNEGGIGIPSNGGEMDAYQMIADVLFQEYSIGTFAGVKRATRINLVNFSLDVYSHNFLNEALRSKRGGDQRNVVGDTFPTRFGSFGYASIEFPTDRLQSACGARLAIQILDFWQKNLLEDPLERLFTRFLTNEDVRFAQGRLERRDGGGVIERSDIEDALSVYQEEGGRTFNSFLWSKAQKIRQLLEATPVGQKSRVLEQQLEELDKLYAREDSEDSDEWGLAIRQLETNRREYLERVTGGIDKLARATADNPKHGVAYTLSLLRELKSLLRSDNFPYLSHFETEIETWRDEIQRQGYRLEQLKLDMNRHEQQTLFRKANLSWDLDQLAGADEEAPPGALYGYYYSRTKKQIAKRGKSICEAVDDFLGKDDVTGNGLLGRYWKLLSGFAQLEERFRKKEEYFAAERKSELVVSLYQRSDFDQWFQRWTGEGAKHQDTLQSVGNQLLQRVFKVDTVSAAIAQIQHTSPAELEDLILAQCKDYFISQEEQPQALEILMDKRYDGRRERLVRNAYELAKVWLEPAGTGVDHVGIRPVVADQRPCIIGVDKDNTLRFPEFRQLIDTIRSSGDSPPSFQNTGKSNGNAILFYNELAGVPIFYPGAITRPGGMRSAYLGTEDKDDLHFDKNRFQFGDLLPKTAAEAKRYANSVKAFVLARVLGLLKIKEIPDRSNQSTLHYSYSRQIALGYEDVHLGTENQAIDALFRDARDAHETDRRQLLLAAEESLQALRSQSLLWVYGLLLDFYLYHVYPPLRDEGWVSNLTLMRYSPEYAVLASARDELQNIFPSEVERRKLREALDAKRRGKQGEEMTYEEYLQALGPHVRMAGRFEVQTESVVVDQRAFLEAPVLDRQKLMGADRSYPAPAAPSSQENLRPEGERPCPNCSEILDIRAVFCTHCSQTIASHVPCEHCGEQRVPDDLSHCWSCGTPMRQDSKIECPQCFSWSGYKEDFPCQVCGYDLAAPAPEPVTSSMEKANGSTTAATVSNTQEHPPSPPAEAEVMASSPDTEKVECPTCYSMVDPGPKCSVCDGLL